MPVRTTLSSSTVSRRPPRRVSSRRNAGAPSLLPKTAATRLLLLLMPSQRSTHPSGQEKPSRCFARLSTRPHDAWVRSGASGRPVADGMENFRGYGRCAAGKSPTQGRVEPAGVNNNELILRSRRPPTVPTPNTSRVLSRLNIPKQNQGMELRLFAFTSSSGNRASARRAPWRRRR